MSTTAPEAAPVSPASMGLPAGARRYLGLVVATAVAATAVAITQSAGSEDWQLFLLLLGLGSIAQTFAVHTAGNQVFHTGLVFTVAGALVLPVELVVALCVGQHLAEWVKQRYPWYIQTFNIANYVVSSLAATATARWILGAAPDGGANTFILAGSAAAVVFVALNHSVLAYMLKLARAHSLRSSRLFSIDSLMTDVVLALIGVGIAASWRAHAAGLLLTLVPLLLIHRGFTVPELKAQLSVDPKTGLLNMRAFTERATDEAARAQRFNRPLALLMADLDGLRSINARQGHVAADKVIGAAADCFRAEVREYDVVARYGGDEFAILLPETTVADAAAIAERIRERFAAHVHRGRANESFRATISIGVASAGHALRTVEELIDQADQALYVAKRAGGNRVAQGAPAGEALAS